MEGLKWYDHIELAGAFLLGLYIAGCIVNVLIQRWLGKNCSTCQAIADLTSIKLKQSHHREETHLILETTLAGMKEKLENIEEKINTILGKLP